MTIYVKNYTSQDIKYYYRGEFYLFAVGAINSIDEAVLPYQMLATAFSEKNLYHIAQPTQSQINSAVPAIQIFNTGLSAEAEALISGSYGLQGELNAKRVNYLLSVQSLVDSGVSGGQPIQVKPILAGGTGTGNATLTVPSSTTFSIQNTGSSALSFTIGSITITLDGLSSFEDNFNSFTSVNIVSTDTYNWYTK